MRFLGQNSSEAQIEPFTPKYVFTFFWTLEKVVEALKMRRLVLQLSIHNLKYIYTWFFSLGL